MKDGVAYNKNSKPFVIYKNSFRLLRPDWSSLLRYYRIRGWVSSEHIRFKHFMLPEEFLVNEDSDS